MASVRPEPFTIRVEDSVLEDLAARLQRARLPDQDVENDDWSYGSELKYIKELLDYWTKDFDWRKMETYLNSGFGCGAQHYTMRLPLEEGNLAAGLVMHYVHARAAGGAPGVPLLLLHGWPGSFFEFHKLFPLLTAAGFDVVAPSLPGYGFSERPRVKHFDTAAMARSVDLLMRTLGYRAYVAQGGDWGALITKHLGQLASTGELPSCKAIHVNMVIAGPPPKEARAQLSDAERREEDAALRKRQIFQAQETGYQQIQGTKPQTLGFGLMDSPIGLLAWLVEKFRSWSDCGGHPEKALSKDEMLTGVMLYWVTGCITSSTRLYYETLGLGAVGGEAAKLFARPVTIPTGLARFPGEPFNAPRSWARHAFTHIVREGLTERGGHFAAWEAPELLAEEIRLCFLEAVDARKLCGVESSRL